MRKVFSVALLFVLSISGVLAQSSRMLGDTAYIKNDVQQAIDYAN